MGHRIVWFDLPVADLARARSFYGAVLAADLVEDYPGVSVLPHGPQDVAGCLVQSDDATPSRHGALLYLNVDGRLQQAVDQAAAHGGTVERPPHEIAPFGHRALVIDSEGNRIALHSDAAPGEEAPPG